MNSSHGLLPLQLAINGDGLRLFLARKQDPAFAKFQRVVLQRDDYCCRYCGFRSARHQEIVNIDGNYLNNKISNLATACCFCQQCLFLDAVGNNANSGGKLIWLPEMSQGQLNALAHVLFGMMRHGGSYGKMAHDIYKNLVNRNAYLSKTLNIDLLSDAAEVGRYLLNLSQSEQECLLQTLFAKVSLLPAYANFTVALDDWEQESRELLNM